MKKLKYLLFIALFSFPIIIKAEMNVIYTDAVKYQEKYITNFTLYYKTIINGSSVKFGNNGSLYLDSDFKYAGFLNKKEYEIAGTKNSYLYDGQNYWLMTKEGSNAYIISSNISNESALDTSTLNRNNGTRYTVFLKKYLNINGEGTYLKPWKIEEIKDFAAPVVSATAPSSRYSKIVSISINATENTGGTGLGENDYSYYASNSDSTLSGGTLTKYTFNTPFSIGASYTGNKYLFVKQVSDVVENYSKTNGVMTTIDGQAYHRFGPYLIDNTVPTCTISKNTTAVSSSVTLTVTGSDNTGRLNASAYSWTNNTSGFSTTRTKTVNKNGTYYAWVKDEAGNVSGACSITVTNVDDVKPTCTITKNTTVATQTAVLTITGSDNSGQFDTYPYSWTSASSGFSTTRTKTITANGTYYAWVKDKSGNVSNYCSITVSNIDRTPPTCNITKNVSSWTTSLTLTVNPTASDVASYSWTNASSGFSGTRTRTITANGTYYAWVKDVAGNVGRCQTSPAVTNIDRTPPTCSISYSPTYSTTYVALYISVSDTSGAMAAAPYSWNGSSYTTSNSMGITSNGTYYAWVKDQAGNVGTCSINIGNINTRAPYTPSLRCMYLYCSVTCDNNSPTILTPRTCNLSLYGNTNFNGNAFFFDFQERSSDFRNLMLIQEIYDTSWNYQRTIYYGLGDALNLLPNYSHNEKIRVSTVDGYTSDLIIYVRK